MLKIRKTNCAGFFRCSLNYALLVLLLFLAPIPPAYAVDVETLFSVEVTLDDEAEDSRDVAYKTALIEILTRVSGSELSTNEEAIDELFPVPSAYVTQFRLGAEGALRVSFDGEAIEAALRNAGQIVWGRDRPLTLIWLAVDWGQGEREIIAAGEPYRTMQQSRSIDRNRLLRKRIFEIAEKRGLPLFFPLLDTTDLQSVTFSDIWGGFDERIIEASERYKADSILIGRIRPESNQRNRWSYFFGGEGRVWTGPPEMIVAQIADLLAAEFAVGGNAPLEEVVLNVSGVDTIDAFGSIQKLLAAISLIEGFRISEVTGDTVTYQVEMRGGAERLRRALRFAGLLEQVDLNASSDPESSSALEFFFNL